MSHQRGYVFLARSQSWQQHREDIESIIKVAAKLVPLHHLLQISVCGGNHSDIYAMRSTASETFEFAFLQNAQQIGLQRQRDIADLVSKERSFVRKFEASDFLCNRSGESSFFMTKELAFQ